MGGFSDLGMEFANIGHFFVICSIPLKHVTGSNKTVKSSRNHEVHVTKLGFSRENDPCKNMILVRK